MQHENRPRKDKRGLDLITGALPFGRLWYDKPDAINSATGSARRTTDDRPVRSFFHCRFSQEKEGRPTCDSNDRPQALPSESASVTLG